MQPLYDSIITAFYSCWFSNPHFGYQTSYIPLENKYTLQKQHTWFGRSIGGYSCSCAAGTHSIDPKITACSPEFQMQLQNLEKTKLKKCL